MSQYLGAAILNGPAGAPDTPERFMPRPLTGVPTVAALVISAELEEEARDKQVLWHCLQRRIFELQGESPLLPYAEGRIRAIALLQRLSDRVLARQVFTY